MALQKNNRPNWATGDASYVAMPTSAKRSRGWRPAEKPPSRFMNWLFNMIYGWLRHGEDWDDVAHSIILRSDAQVIWNGTQLSFASDIEIHYKVGGSFYQANIPLEDSVIDIGADQALVIILPEASGDLTSVAYGSIIAGNYSVVDVASITQNDNAHEIILFRRRGSDLEVPLSKRIISSGGTLSLGKLIIHDHTSDDEGGTLDHADLENIGTNTHAQIDSHIANTSNPHSVTYGQTGAAASGHLHDSRYLRKDTSDSMAGQLLLADVDPPSANYANRNSIVKAWANVDDTGAIHDSYNVSSVSKGGSGYYDVYWNLDFASTWYSVVSNPNTSGGTYISHVPYKETTYCTVRTLANGGGWTDVDFGLIAIGDQ